MDPIKDAFLKVKQDMQLMQEQILSLNQSVEEIKRTLLSLKEDYSRQTNQQTDKPTDNPQNPPSRQTNPTEATSAGVTPTDNWALYGLKAPNNETSIGNSGVPTDRQTNQQTDQHIPLSFINDTKMGSKLATNSLTSAKLDHLDQVSQVLDSLDNIKKELRIKVKKLTQQEMLVFSTIYQLEEEGFSVDYPLIASKLTLSESSIRDYTQKIISKGLPILKKKENNKKIILSILPDFRRLATLQTLLTLREI